MTDIFVLLTRDVRLATRAGGSAALALAFFAAVATLVPLGVGPDLGLLARIAGGVLWVAAVLAALLSLDRLFQADFDERRVHRGIARVYGGQVRRNPDI